MFVEIVCISHNAKTFDKGMDPIIPLQLWENIRVVWAIQAWYGIQSKRKTLY